MCLVLPGVSSSGYSVTVTSQGTFADKSFGNYTTAAVSGQKWEDKNANGTKDAGDNGLTGWHRVFNAAGAGGLGSGHRRERQLHGEPHAGHVPDL